MFKKINNTNIPKIIPYYRKREMLPDSLCEASITLILKPDWDIINKEICRVVSLISTNIKILNKILATLIQQNMKIICHQQNYFIPKI